MNYKYGLIEFKMLYGSFNKNFYNKVNIRNAKLSMG